MNDSLFIPERLNVGFQNRSDTYTGKLAYVTCFDTKGKLRKETSWEGWRDKEITPIEFKNVPTEGFVLNKKVGGVRSGWSWNSRVEKVRVYDPRNFEFEISIPNLLFILNESNAIKGKGLEGKFVYSWSGAELVLLPVDSREYKESQKYTALQSQKVSAKTLIVGATYMNKKKEKLVYLGKHFWYNTDPEYIGRAESFHSGKKSKEKKYIFFNLNSYEHYKSDKRSHANYVQYYVEAKSDLTSLATVFDENVADNYADLFDIFAKSKHAGPVAKIFHQTLDSTNFILKLKPSRYYYGSEPESDNSKYINALKGDDHYYYEALVYRAFVDGTYTQYKVEEYLTYSDTPDKYGTRTATSAGLKLVPKERISFKDGVITKRSLKSKLTPLHQYKGSYYGNRIEYYTTLDHRSGTPDNKVFAEEIILQKEDFPSYGFIGIFVQLESGAKLKIQDY